MKHNCTRTTLINYNDMTITQLASSSRIDFVFMHYNPILGIKKNLKYMFTEYISKLTIRYLYFHIF